jgi:hypothetical protein
MKLNRHIAFLFLFVIGFSFSFGLKAQDCKLFFPTEKGTFLEMTSYDKKGKVTGYSTQKILEAKDVDGAFVVAFEQAAYDKKHENEMKTEMEVRCKDGKFYFDLSNYLQGMDMEEYETNPDMEVVVDGDEIFYPAELNPGEQLPDGSLSMKVLSNGFSIINMKVDITNRKVEARESITTPAGTFECYKITQDIELKTIMRIRSKETTWLADEIGVVKTETYDKKGKLTGTTELTKIER